MSAATTAPAPEDAISVIDDWMRVPTLKLRAGEMSAQEVRSVIAVLGSIRASLALTANRVAPAAATRLEPIEPPALSDPIAKTLHLMTQRGQPYGSERRCCERCGLMLVARSPEFWAKHAWTDDPEQYHDDHLGILICT